MKSALFLLLLSFAFHFSHAQILKKLKEAVPASNVLEKKPITTNFKDVNTAGSLSPDFGSDASYKPLHGQPKNESGEWLLEPGFYEITNLSYCLKAGTNGPSKGDAYGLAFLEGRMADIVEAILVNSQKLWRGETSLPLKPSQRDVQLLLWAIIAKANFEDMQGRTKAVALALLTPQQILKLNGGAVKTVTNFASEKGWLDKPEWMRKIEEAEQNLRQMYMKADASYEDFERLALLAGMAAEPNPFEAGTWFKHEQGFYVRFEPNGYPRTKIKVYVPEGGQGRFKATGMVATPSDSRQRLAQTDLAVEEYQRSPLGKLN